MTPPKSLTSITGTYPITGIQAGLSEKRDDPLRKVPQRMDLDDWYLSEDAVHKNQRALFFPAFQRFCHEDPNSKFSFYQIAGIHGQPIAVWDEPDQPSEWQNVKREGEGEFWRSYCHHGQTTFATWHRPYMLLFEQVIYEYMRDLAETKYSGDERKAMLFAAANWRLPYWDWAEKKPIDYKDRSKGVDYNLPLAFLDRDINIEGVAQQQGVPSNPLYQFTMPGQATLGGTNSDMKPELRVQDLSAGRGLTFTYSATHATSRYPDGDRTKWLNGAQDNKALVNTLRDTYIAEDPKRKPGVVNESLRDAFGRLFSVRKFEDFASTELSTPIRFDAQKKPTAWRDKEPVFSNCESLHNSMHVWCGGPAREERGSRGIVQRGHMSDPQVAAFDPLFWFHHCNIDRSIAIWQAISELEGDRKEQDKWFDVQRNKYSVKAESQPLRPFHLDTKGTYWTSKNARDTVSLGYTYPILDKQKFIKNGVYNKAEHLNFINTELNTKYNAARAAAAKAALTADPGETDRPGLMSLSMLLAAVPNPESFLDQTVNDYAVNVVYEKMGLGGRPFTISIFVGKVSEVVPYDFHDPESSLVGQVYNFTSPDEGETRCDNCAEQARNKTLASGRVVLTNSLITRWKQQLVHHPDPGVDGPTVLASMDPHDVVPFLTANLHWRITAGGHRVDPADVPSVKVCAVVGKAEHFADLGKLSKYHDYVPAYQVTAGKPAGAGPEDHLYPEGVEWQP